MMNFRGDDIQKGFICYQNLDILKNKDKIDKERGNRKTHLNA